MTDSAAPRPLAAEDSRFAALSLVRDGDGYIVGSTYTTGYVAVPEIGGEVVRWLQAGHGVQECADRAARRMGEPVDVAGFVDGLAAAGLLPAAVSRQELIDRPGAGDEPPHPQAAPAVSAWARRAGRVLFGRTGLTMQVALVGAGLVAMVANPRLRPAYTDVLVTDVPLLSVIVVTVLGTISALVHEYAHVLAAAARGVPGRVTISRRLVTIVYQTNLTRLWGVPRSARVVPLLAGLLSDGATVGVLLLLETASVTSQGSPLGTGSLAVHVIRVLVFVKLAGMVFQCEIFMRTDLYALFVVATGCRNLWATKGAVARRAIRRATADDLAVLASVGHREIFWARVYLLLYLPGLAWTGWYAFALAVPALRRLVAMSAHAVADSGPLSPLGAAGILALGLLAASTAFVLLGLTRSALRTGGHVLNRATDRRR